MDMAKPKIRFNGYTEDWEQRKLGELYIPLTERNTDLLPYSKTISVATMTFKVDGNGAADTSLANYKRLRIGDIAFEGHMSKEFRYGRFVLNNVGDGIMSPRFSALRPIQNMPINFWKYYIHYEPIMKRILVKSTKAGTMMNELVVDEFLQETILVPKEDEQKRIGGIIATLDHLITLHQRKCEETKKLKKYMLQKMFPQNGQLVPEIRFSGFTEDWEQRKLGEVCEIKDSARIPNFEWEESGVPYIRASDIANEDINGILFISQERYEFYKNRTGAPTKNDVLFNGGGEIGKSLLITDEKPIYVQGGAVLYARTSEANELVGQYLKTYFETDHARSYIDAASAGGTMKHFTLKPSQLMPILMPMVHEQEKIGEYFASLDHLITLHQHKCEELQKIKKFMLQNMFV